MIMCMHAFLLCTLSGIRLFVNQHKYQGIKFLYYMVDHNNNFISVFVVIQAYKTKGGVTHSENQFVTSQIIRTKISTYQDSTQLLLAKQLLYISIVTSSNKRNFCWLGHLIHLTQGKSTLFMHVHRSLHISTGTRIRSSS